jgi:hypothetical protein
VKREPLGLIRSGISVGGITVDGADEGVGAVLPGIVEGRQTNTDITVYESLEHIAQGLALSCYLSERDLAEGFCSRVPF